MKVFARILLALASGAFLFTGCAGDVCTKAEKASTHIEEVSCKFEGSDESGFETEDPEEVRTTCESEIGQCNSAEQLLVEEYFDCILDLPKCASGKEDEWFEKAAKCFALAESVSCLDDTDD